jgi:hypothetical protein
MFKGATAIFAISIFLFSCASQVTNTTQPPLSTPSAPPSAPQPVLLPNLAISDISLSETGKLEVMLSNTGEGPAPYGVGSLAIYVDGLLQWKDSLGTLPDQTFLEPGGTTLYTTPIELVGKQEVRAVLDKEEKTVEENKLSNVFPKVLGKEKSEAKPIVPGLTMGEGKSLKRSLDGLPVGPDIVVKDLDLTEDLELMIILSNAGEVDLRKGAIFQIQMFVNDQKMSEFDHFISEVLKANLKSRYRVAPPYQVVITGISKVKVSISPELPSDDIRLENNIHERTFILFPFKIRPQGKEEFSFSFFPPRLRSKSQPEKLTIEARCEWGSSSLMLSFKKSGSIKGTPALSGKSPLKVEFPIPLEEIQKEIAWSIFMTNLAEKKVEGHLIIQHP